MAAVLTDEQLEELAGYLKGTNDDLEDGLTELGVNIRERYYPSIMEELADRQEIEQCFLCGYWTFSEAFSFNENAELVCSNCVVTLNDDEDWR